MQQVNKHGLPRRIPADVAREVRQRCGFGCVRCGKAIIDYEHFDPPFEDCTEHRAAGITLLCVECHAHKTRGWLAVEEIRDADASPYCKRAGFSFGPFYIGQKGIPSVLIGGLMMINVKTHIKIHGDEVLAVKAPEVDGGPFRLSAQLFDSTGKLVLKIVDNEWQVRSDNWDVEAAGAEISIRRGKGDIALVLSVEPPGRLIVERLNFLHRGVKMTCSKGQPLVVEQGGPNRIVAASMVMEGCEEGIVFENQTMTVGVGCGRVWAGNVTFGGGGRPRPKQPGQAKSAPRTSSPPAAGPFISEEVFRRVLRANCPCGSGKAYAQCHGCGS